jgi:hypothetical protein
MDMLMYLSQQTSEPARASVARIEVPADVVARSRPSRHSVPLAHARHKVARTHPFRNLAVAFLIALVPLIGIGVLIYYSAAEERSAGNHVVCVTEGVGRFMHPVCGWER